MFWGQIRSFCVIIYVQNRVFTLDEAQLMCVLGRLTWFFRSLSQQICRKGDHVTKSFVRKHNGYLILILFTKMKNVFERM